MSDTTETTLPSYVLANCEAQHTQHPDSHVLLPGDVVKLGFVSLEPDILGESEWMWVEVTARDGHSYIGRLRNNALQHPLAYGDLVTFAAEHVYDIRVEGEQS